jgi:hypothetical protein
MKPIAVLTGEDALLFLLLKRHRAAGTGMDRVALEIMRTCQEGNRNPPPAHVVAVSADKLSGKMLTSSPRADIKSAWDAISTD